MPCLHAPAKNRLTILARANGRDTTIALPRSDRVVGTCSSPATSISLPHMRDVPCAESRWRTRSQRDDRVGRGPGAPFANRLKLARAEQCSGAHSVGRLLPTSDGSSPIHVVRVPARPAISRWGTSRRFRGWQRKDAVSPSLASKTTLGC
jgi:hypothetical protein